SPRCGVGGIFRDFGPVPLLGHGEWVGSAGAA
ncbi:hypothetical protein J2Z78_001992, partial [Streptomyces griseorubens]